MNLKTKSLTELKSFRDNVKNALESPDAVRRKKAAALLPEILSELAAREAAHRPLDWEKGRDFPQIGHLDGVPRASIDKLANHSSRERGIYALTVDKIKRGVYERIGDARTCAADYVTSGRE